jgi:hypothetical protein
MPRSMYTRDELAQALRVAARFLESLPESLTLAAIEDITTPRAPLPQDGAIVNGSMPGDGMSLHSPSKGQPQPARKQYAPAPRVRPQSVDWAGVTRAARRVGDLVLQANQPLTSHAIMSELKIARSTFDNAISELLRRKIISAVPVSGRSVERR